MTRRHVFEVSGVAGENSGLVKEYARLRLSGHRACCILGKCQLLFLLRNWFGRNPDEAPIGAQNLVGGHPKERFRGGEQSSSLAVRVVEHL